MGVYLCHRPKCIEVITFFISGKTLLCKARAILSGEDHPTHNIFYICMVGTHKNGNPRKERFLFDVCTKNFEMKNTAARPIDVPDLIDFYDANHKEYCTVFDANEVMKECRLKKRLRNGNGPASLIDSYELTKFFIQRQVEQNDNCHFILDEVPIFQQKGNYIYSNYSDIF